MGVVRSYPFGPVDRLEIDPMYGWLRDHEPLSRVQLPYGDEENSWYHQHLTQRALR